MANAKIIDLPAIVTQSSTDLYEVSLNGSESVKETRAQMLSYMNSNIQLGSTSQVTGLSTALAAKANLSGSNVFSGYNTFNQVYIKGQQSNVITPNSGITSGTISAANIIAGITPLDPSSDGTVFTLDTASNIKSALISALGNNLVNFTSFRSQITNIGSTNACILNPGTDTLLNGMPTNILLPGQTFDLIFVFTDISAPLLIVYGGTNLASNEVFTVTASSYTLRLSDLNSYIGFNSSSAQTVTVPANGSLNFPIGGSIDGGQLGTGTVTFVPEDGTVTIDSLGSLTSLSGQYAGFSIKKIASGVWHLVGALA